MGADDSKVKLIPPEQLSVDEAIKLLRQDYTLIERQSFREFLLSEASVYLSQLMMFLLVAVITTNVARDEKALIAAVNSRINANSLVDLIATLIAIMATIGAVYVLKQALTYFPSIDRLLEEVMNELPRVIYVFGSGISGTMFAVSFYIGAHPEEHDLPSLARWNSIAVATAILGFLYGYALSLAIKHKERIRMSKANITK